MRVADEKTKLKYELISKLTKDGFKLSYLEKLSNLGKSFPDDHDLEVECMVWMATIYEENDLTNEALTMYETILDMDHSAGQYLFVVLMNTMKLLFAQGNHEKSRAIFENYFDSPEIHFIAKLNLLAWHVETFDTTPSNMEQVRHSIDLIATKLGVACGGADMREEIMNLKRIHGESNRRHTEFEVGLKGKNKNEAIASLEKYIEADPIPFYKQMAKDSLVRLSGIQGDSRE